MGLTARVQTQTHKELGWRNLASIHVGGQNTCAGKRGEHKEAHMCTRTWATNGNATWCPHPPCLPTALTKPPPPPVKVFLAARKAGKTKWNEIGTLNDIPLIIKKYAYVPASQGRNEKQIYVRTQWACRSETALVKTFKPSQQSLPNSAESTHFNKGSHLKLKAACKLKAK